MNNLVPKTDGYDLIKTSDIVGDHLKFVKHEWIRAGNLDDPASRYAMLMNSVSTGSILWKDSKVADLQAVVPQFRMQGKQAFPIVVLESKPSGNQCGVWNDCSDFGLRRQNSRR